MTITATKPSGSSLNSGTTTYDEYIKVTFTSNVAVSIANEIYSFIESDITISGPGQIKHDSFSAISSTVFEAEIEPTDASVTYDSPLQNISILSVLMDLGYFLAIITFFFSYYEYI